MELIKPSALLTNLDQVFLKLFGTGWRVGASFDSKMEWRGGKVWGKGEETEDSAWEGVKFC